MNKRKLKVYVITAAPAFCGKQKTHAVINEYHTATFSTCRAPSNSLNNNGLKMVQRKPPKRS